MLEKTLIINELIDYYGDILTETQNRSLALYYIYDYSINEIAEELSISKQAASHNIKRGEAKLMELEDKLNLLKKTKRLAVQKEVVTNILIQIKKINKDSVIDEQINKIMEILGNEEV